MKTDLFENADVTASIFYVSEHTLGSFGIMGGQFAYLFSLIEARMSNFVIEYRTALSNIEFRMSQHFSVDGDISENAPSVDADPFLDG